MGIPLIQQARVGAYIMKQQVSGNKRYPLVLMLEPLFRCNLACPGCGKIDYPDEILNKRLRVQECIDAVEECGAPMVSIPGGEPLIHKEIAEIVEALVERKKFVYLCTKALLLEKKLDLFKPTPFLTFSVHLDGLEHHHDEAVAQKGTFKKAVSAIRAAKARGFRVNVNCTLFNNADPAEMAEFFDFVTNDLQVEGITVSPGYAYERAPNAQDPNSNEHHFLNREQTKNLFRDLFRNNKQSGKKKWVFSQSTLFLDFLAGNQTYTCTPWSNPTRNVFGWQRPCYLVGEGYVGSFNELMETTDWDKYGTGNYEKCADCMVHCGYEGTAVTDTVTSPLKALLVNLRGVKTEGEMAPEIDLSKQRPAEWVFDRNVQSFMQETAHTPKTASNESEAQVGSKAASDAA